jgi:hypothetical protein
VGKALRFPYVSIYWYNHHHMFHLVQRVGGGTLWANLVLLFSLSLLPFTTAWITESRMAHTPSLFVYGLNLLLSAAAYFVLERIVIRGQGDGWPWAAMPRSRSCGSPPTAASTSSSAKPSRTSDGASGRSGWATATVGDRSGQRERRISCYSPQPWPDGLVAGDRK